MPKIAKVILLILMICIAFIFGRNTVPEPVQEYSEITNKNEAVEIARNYLKAATYSKEGLIQALCEYEHCDEDVSRSAVESLSTDWQKQANEEVESYLQASGFSETQVREYLKRDLFTDEQIDKAFSIVEPDWKEQAQTCAEFLKQSGAKEIGAILLMRGFTQEQVAGIEL